MTASPARYEIRAEDVPGEDWSAWFDRLQATSDRTGTVISGVVPDQPTRLPPRRADAFHLVIPTIPGCGFSGPTGQPGWDFARIAGAWAELMRRLGYDRYAAQGGTSAP